MLEATGALVVRTHAYGWSPAGTPPGFAERVWELRANLSSYDAWYVAIAELADMPLATLDQKLTRAPGPGCEFLLPP